MLYSTLNLVPCKHDTETDISKKRFHFVVKRKQKYTKDEGCSCGHDGYDYIITEMTDDIKGKCNKTDSDSDEEPEQEEPEPEEPEPEPEEPEPEPEEPEPEPEEPEEPEPELVEDPETEIKNRRKARRKAKRKASKKAIKKAKRKARSF